MSEHDLPTYENAFGSEGRQARLLTAAQALRTLAHGRRATWSAEPLDIALAARAPQVVEIVAPPPTPAIPRPVIQDAAPPPPVRPATVKPATVPMMSSIASGVGALSEPLMRWSRHIAVVAAVLAVVVGGVWAARTYLPKISETMTKPAAPTTGTAVIESVPAGSQVLVDGKMAGTTPFTTELAVGRHVIEFRRLKATRKMEIDVTAGASTLGRLDWTSKRTGRLQVDSEPAGAQVIVDGRARGVTPVTLDGLTAGPHEVVLKSDDGSVRQSVDITADRTAEISEAIFAGWVQVSSPIELTITEGTRAIHLDDRNQVLLPPGTHELRFESRALGYHEIRRVEVKPGATTAISIVPAGSTLTVTSTLPAEVLVDGERVGETPLTGRPLSLGTRDIVVKSATGPERRFTITVTAAPVRLDVDFAAP